MQNLGAWYYLEAKLTKYKREDAFKTTTIIVRTQ